MPRVGAPVRQRRQELLEHGQVTEPREPRASPCLEAQQGDEHEQRDDGHEHQHPRPREAGQEQVEELAHGTVPRHQRSTTSPSSASRPSPAGQRYQSERGGVRRCR